MHTHSQQRQEVLLTEELQRILAGLLAELVRKAALLGQLLQSGPVKVARCTMRATNAWLRVLVTCLLSQCHLQDLVDTVDGLIESFHRVLSKSMLCRKQIDRLRSELVRHE